MNKREAVLALLNPAISSPYIPAAFFLHFSTKYHQGQDAIDKHLEYFRYTDMDFIKVQYEHSFPKLPNIQRPEDWSKIPLFKKDFFEPPLKVVEGLVNASKKDALGVVTLYSPFMLAGQLVGDQTRDKHLMENPEAVKKGLEVVTQSLLYFVRGCKELGLDGFYASTQGGEKGHFENPVIFKDYIKPFDLTIWEEIKTGTIFNILHICDYHLPYDDLTQFIDYPGQVVNCPIQVAGNPIGGKEIATLFNRPSMGGMDRHGIIVSGSALEIQQAVERVVNLAPERFILGADCTLPGDVSWDNIRIAIDAAHHR